MIKCKCCQKHVPLPTTYYQITDGESVLWLCPTTFHNLTELLTQYKLFGQVPEGSIRKHYSAYTKNLAERMWQDNLTNNLDVNTIVV